MAFNVLVFNPDKSSGQNFVKCLQLAKEKQKADYFIVGASFDSIRAHLANTDLTVILPQKVENDILSAVNIIKKKSKKNIDLVYQTLSADFMLQLSEKRDVLPVFLPSHESIKIFEDKYKTYLVLKKGGFLVPETILPQSKEEFFSAIKELNADSFWVRYFKGQGGKGSFFSSNPKEIAEVIEKNNGWGKYAVSEKLPSIDLSKGWKPHLSNKLLPGEMITWIALYDNGRLVAAQTRKRLYWEHSSLTASGVTGYSGANMTISRKDIHKLCDKMIRFIDKKPNGAMGADFVVNNDCKPVLTEIQASRFYTSTYPLALLGLNLPYLYIECFKGNKPRISKPVNPCKAGMIYIQRFGAESKLIDLKTALNAIRSGLIKRF